MFLSFLLSIFSSLFYTWPNYSKYVICVTRSRTLLYTRVRVCMQVYAWWELTWLRTHTLHVYHWCTNVSRTTFFLDIIIYVYVCMSVRIRTCVFIYVCMCVWVPTCQSIGTEEWTKTERNETIAKEGSRQAASSSSTPGLETELARGPFRSTPPRLFSLYYLPSQPIPQTSPLQPPRTP